VRRVPVRPKQGALALDGRGVPGYLRGVLRLAAQAAPVTEMSAGAAVIGIFVALLVGFYGARWLRAERDEQRAKVGLAAIVRAMWAARRAMIIVAVIGIVVIDLWLRGSGR
jgi:hypothetical protein